MPDKPTNYCFICTYATGSDKGRPLASGGKLVLFDTREMAQQFMPLLGNGRMTSWSKDGESAFWAELDPAGFNRADIVTDYDPFDTPVGFPGGIRSEVKGREWKHHVMWSHAFFDCGGNMSRQLDGTIVNAAVTQ